MKKVVIQVEETIRYEDEIIVVQPENMTDEEFDELINVAERENKRFEGGAKDLAYILSLKGIEIHDQSYNFPDSPNGSEFEIVDIRDVK